jgi:methylated-DNA-[protein]-cysteine S-methyltransferase
MSNNGTDPIIQALGELTEAPPAGLFDRVVSRWIRTTTPLDELYIAFSDHGISYLRTATSTGHSPTQFTHQFHQRFNQPLIPTNQPPTGLLTALRTGRTRHLTLDLRTLTPFEKDVLTTTTRIPTGQTRPYTWIAHQIGRPHATRAVGTALANNPLPLLIPCHRVTRANGHPGNYIFGTTTKETLLHTEHVNLTEIRQLAKAHIHYIGSDTTHIVCYPTCHHARRITTPHRHGFRTLHQAHQAGYRPCQHCQPTT